MVEQEIQAGQESESVTQAPAPIDPAATPAAQEPAPKSFREILAEKAAKNGIQMDSKPDAASEIAKPDKPAEKPAPAAKPEEKPLPKVAEKDPAKPAEKTDPIVVEPASWAAKGKFKVMDKEHDVPEFLKGAIKDAESEKSVTELLEKAYGLDFIKPRFKEARDQLKTVSDENTAMKSDITDLKATYGRGDLDGFFAKLNIPQEKILQYVLSKLEYSQLPPEQQRVLDERHAADRRAWEAESRAGQVEEKYYAQAAQAKQYALESSLARPDFQTVSQSFDERVGKPGAFREAVVQHGQLVWLQTQGKTDLTPEQAIQGVMTMYGLTAQAPQAPAATTPTGAAAVVPPAQASGTQNPPVVKPAVNVLPNVSGRGTSPMPSRPRSIADLKKRYDEIKSG